MYHCSGKPAPPLLRRWGLNRSLALGAGGSPLPGKRQPGEVSPGAPIALPARRSAPCRRSSRRGARHCCQGTKKAPGFFRGPRSQTEELSKVSQLQLLKSLAGLPSRGAVTPDAAPMAEWGRRPSGAIVSLSAGKQWQGMEHGFRALRYRATGGRKLPPRPPLCLPSSATRA